MFGIVKHVTGHRHRNIYSPNSSVHASKIDNKVSDPCMSYESCLSNIYISIFITKGKTSVLRNACCASNIKTWQTDRETTRRTDGQSLTVGQTFDEQSAPYMDSCFGCGTNKNFSSPFCDVESSGNRNEIEHFVASLSYSYIWRFMMLCVLLV